MVQKEKREKRAPPKPLVARGLGHKGDKPGKDAKSASRMAGAMAAFERVKANSVTDKGEGKKAFKNDWWMKFQPPPSGVCIIKLNEETPWHSLIDTEAEGEVKKLDKHAIESLTKRVEGIFEDEVNKYEKVRRADTSTDAKWMDDMIKAGTFSDKIAAMALRIQGSPVHQLDTLDAMIHLAGKSEQRTANTALEAIKDLFTHTLLPDRPLVKFENRALGAKALTMDTALLYYFEGQLAKRVGRVVDALEKGMKGALEHFKKQCMEMAAAMLKSKPEQEGRLLSLLVNKLGDNSGNVCAKAIEILKGVMRAHPAMKRVVVREVHDLLFRPALPTKTLYSGIVFLTQVPLDNKGGKDGEVAALLVEGYIVLFQRTVGKDELRARLLSALLTGINKTFPFLSDTSALEKHTDELFKIAHADSFTSATQALTLLSHIALSNTSNTSDGNNSGGGSAGTGDLQKRFYRALYAKLLSDQLTTRTRNTQFLNLLYRSVKRDTCEERAGAFLKRLAMGAVNSAPNIAAGLLMLVSEVLKARPALVAMLSSTEGDGDNNNEKKKKNVKGNTETQAASATAGSTAGENRDVFGPYDASKREPQYAATSLPNLWEAALLRCHAHPSVKQFAASLLSEPHAISFAGDPTVDFTLNAFLNRFAFKNPKAKDSAKIRRALPTPEQPLNTSAFLNSSAEDVSDDKLFFHRFFGQQKRLRMQGLSRDRSVKGRKGRSEDDEGGDDEDGDEEDAFQEKDNSDEEDEDEDEEGVAAGFSEDGADSDDNADETDDEEAAMDRFADGLAQDLMRQHADGEDPDMDDFSSDGEDGEDGEGDDGDDGDGLQEGSDFSEEEEEEEEEEDAELSVGGSDYDDSSEGEFDEPIAKASKKGQSKRKRDADGDGDDVFAAHSGDYEDMMDQIMQDMAQREAHPVAEVGGGGGGKGKGKGKKAPPARAAASKRGRR